MAKVQGRFYFKRTTNGNLIGEWSNNNETRAFSESSDWVSLEDSAYVGMYNSTWQEGQNPVFAKLAITKKQGGSLFKLEWRGKANFDGEGMLCEDLLIGDYHQVP